MVLSFMRAGRQADSTTVGELMQGSRFVFDRNCADESAMPTRPILLRNQLQTGKMAFIPQPRENTDMQPTFTRCAALQAQVDSPK